MHPLEPWHAVEAGRDQHHHELWPALALRWRAVEVVDARSPDQRPLDRPAVRHALQIELKLPLVQTHTGSVAPRRYSNSSASCGPTQAIASSSATPRATSTTSSQVTASRAAIEASGSISSP